MEINRTIAWKETYISTKEYKIGLLGLASVSIFKTFNCNR